MSAPALAPAQQPGLRSFIVQSTVPYGCITFEVHNNRCAPHLRRGDVAIVDTTDRAPMHGELFAIQWMGGGQGIVEVGQHKGVHDAHTLWRTYSRSPMISLSGDVIDARWADGPFPAAVLAEKLIGRVVGIHEPAAATSGPLSARIAGARDVRDLEALRDELFNSISDRLPLSERIRIVAEWERRRGELGNGEQAA